MKDNKIIDFNTATADKLADKLDGMSEKDIDTVFDTLVNNVPESIKNMRDVIDNTVVDVNAPLESETVTTNVNSAVRLNEQGLLETDMSIFDVEDDMLEEENVEVLAKSVKTQAAAMFDMSDEDGAEFLKVVLAYREDKNYPVYRNLPEKLKAELKKMMLSEGIPMSNINFMATFFVDQFLAESKADQAFVDLQKSIDEAVKMPSITDMYSEHMDQVMNEKIPEAAQKFIEDGLPEKAQLLLDIKDIYASVYDMSTMMEFYKNSARARKSVRKRYEDYQKFLDEVNMKNEKSKFKMDDAQNIYTSLEKAFIVDMEDDEAYDPKWIKKVIVLFCESCNGKDAESIRDASYMYYTMKNFIHLGFVKEDKTDFTVQLINNIKMLIDFIKSEEDKLNVSANAQRGHK